MHVCQQQSTFKSRYYIASSFFSNSFRIYLVTHSIHGTIHVHTNDGQCKYALILDTQTKPKKPFYLAAGPINVKPFFSTISTNFAFSDKKPYPTLYVNTHIKKKNVARECTRIYANIYVLKLPG